MLTGAPALTRPGGGHAPRRVPRLRTLLAVGLPLLAGALHVAAVAPHYFVGSFDDDAGYILGARALLAGHGLAGHTASGAVVAGAYPPGYPALLVPLQWAFPHTFVPLRALSALCYAGLFPLTWMYLGRRGLRDGIRVSVLVLLALSPVGATFASMVMPEMPFLVTLVAVLLALDRWEADPRVVCPAGVGVALGAAGLVWLKEAGIGLVAGLVVWLVITRRWRKGAVVAGTVGASLVPVVVVRLAGGLPLAGARYSQELGAYYHGSLADRLVHVFPAALHQYLSVALPATVVPSGDPLPQLGWQADALRYLAWQVTLLCALGLVVWARRHRDATVVMVPAYIAETLLWPYINERRVILVLPVVLAWYALGAWTAGGALLSAARRAGRGPAATVAAGGALGVLAAAVVVAPLAAQSTRDYLFGDHQDSSRPGGSRYMAVLASAPPGTVVETDYLSTVALFSGHRTADTAFLANNPLASVLRCTSPSASLAGMTADGAGFLLTGALNKPFEVDNPCLFSQATRHSWAVRLLRSSRDGASVFELVGPGTVHPDLRDLTAGAAVSGSGPMSTWHLAPQFPGGDPGVAPVTAGSGRATLTWDWGRPAALSQVSVGGARSLDGPTRGVSVQVRLAAGRWVTVASARSGVGDPPGDAPFLLARLPAGTYTTALRVVVEGPGRVAAVDVHALGPGGGT